MEKISPKKYIETKARKLPIDKCYVNQDWQISKMADVFVFRKHITGNITWGAYLIDLLCLGVKDSWYNFNVPTDEIAELLEKFEANGIIEIDYNLAHNITFAGYDFATNIGLPAHKEFALTKFILEEDDDTIPIVDIEVGIEDETPHLVISKEGKEKWAIAILNKSIGEGEYYLSNIDEDEEGYDEEAEEIPLRSQGLNDYEIGTIDANDAEMLTDEALQDENGLKQREVNEIMCIGIEYGIRKMEANGLIEKIELDDYVKTPEFILYENSEVAINSNNGLVYLDEFENVIQIEDLLKTFDPLSKKKGENTLRQIYTAYKNNFFALYNLYTTLIWEPEMEELRHTVCKELSNFTEEYPLSTLLLAYESVHNSPDIRYAKIAVSKNIADCFPQCENFSDNELLVYWLIKLKQNIKENNLQNAVFYYRLAADTVFEIDFLFIKTQHDFSEYLLQKVESMD